MTLISVKMSGYKSVFVCVSLSLNRMQFSQLVLFWMISVALQHTSPFIGLSLIVRSEIRMIFSKICFIFQPPLPRVNLSCFIGRKIEILLRSLIPYLVFDLTYCTLKKKPALTISYAARCYLPREWRQKYILHFLSDWTLRHLDCFLYNLNITAQMATCFVQFQLCEVLVLHWFLGSL